MFRKTLTILSLLGLLLCAGLWVASYWNWKYTDSRVRLMLSGGRVIYLMDYVAHGEHGFHFDGWSKWTPTKWWPERSDWPGQRWIAIPLWLPALIFATPYAALRLATIRRRYRRERTGLCVRCGHKLEGLRVRCSACEARVNVVSVLRGVVIRCVFLVMLLVSGSALASYRNYSWTSWNGSSFRIAKGCFTYSWVPYASVSKRVGGFGGLATDWLPRIHIPSSKSAPPRLSPPLVPSAAVTGGSYFPMPGTPTTAPKDGWIVVPLWPLTMALGLLLWYLWLNPSRQQRKRVRLGLCLRCGYDLRGSTARCPECGTACPMDRPRLQSGE